MFNVLFLGFGDIAQRVSVRLPQEEYRSFGLRRRIEFLPGHVHPLSFNLNQETGLVNILNCGFDLVLITLKPNERSEEGYRQTFVCNMKKIIAALSQAQRQPKQIFFVSSTSVYGQDAGEWVDENSPADPINYNGRLVLEAETLLAGSGLPHSILRFSGIYGPGRNRLVDQVKSQKWSESDAYTISNRIHAEDGAGFIACLMAKAGRGESLESCYLVSDDEPVTLYEVKSWLAKKLKLPHPNYIEIPQSFKGKRCANKKLNESGYRLKYPSFKIGYAELINEI